MHKTEFADLIDSNDLRRAPTSAIMAHQPSLVTRSSGSHPYQQTIGTAHKSEGSTPVLQAAHLAAATPSARGVVDLT